MPPSKSTAPLSGEEIIIDLLETIALKLRGNCNLRETDAYRNGYSAKVSIDIECYGLDSTKIHTDISVGEQQDDPDTEVIREQINIPQEINMNVVRDRSNLDNPYTVEFGQANQQKKRRYAKSPLPGFGMSETSKSEQ